MSICPILVINKRQILKRQGKLCICFIINLKRLSDSELLVSFFFYQCFLSRTLTTHRTTGEGRGPSFIPFYHFHPVTNIQTFTCNFAHEMAISYFLWQCLYLPHCYSMRVTQPYRITIWFIDDVMLVFVCLLFDLILGFVTGIWHEKPANSNSHSLSSLYSKRADEPSVLVTPNFAYI